MMDKAVVRWADGTYDINRTCIMDHSPKCSMPVYTERYEVKGTDQWEIDLNDEDVELAGIGFMSKRRSIERVDAVDVAIASENYAPEENEYDD